MRLAVTLIVNTKGVSWIYTGQWERGHMEGLGQMLWPDSNKKYIGNYINDYANGYGTLFENDTITYSGEFKNGEPAN